MASRVPARPLLDEEPAITPQLGFVAWCWRWFGWWWWTWHFSVINSADHEYLFQPRQRIYSPMRHGGKARTPEKSSPGTSVWTLMTSSPCFSQTPNFSTTFRWYLCFTFWEWNGFLPTGGTKDVRHCSMPLAAQRPIRRQVQRGNSKIKSLALFFKTIFSSG